MNDHARTGEEQAMNDTDESTENIDLDLETRTDNAEHIRNDDDVRDEQSNKITSEADESTSNDVTYLLQSLKTQLEKKEQAETERVESLQAELLSLKEMQEKITNDFNEKLKYDDHKEQLIDQLHKELQTYKADVLKSTITPIVNDLIMVSDNIQKLVGNYRSTEEPLDGEEILTHLESVTLDIDNVLFRQGIEPYQCLGEKVEPLKQTISKTIKTGDKADVKKIAERLRKGYEWDDKIIRKEHVSVYVYDEDMAVTENNKDEDEGANNNE